MISLGTMLGAAALGPSRLAAQAEAGEAHAGAESAAEDWRERPNHLAGFMGATLNAEESAFTVGLDYTRRVAPRVSVGAFVDYALGELREFIVGPMVWLYPTERIAIELAPAAEHEDEEWRFVARLGAAYELEFGSLLVGPYAAVDLVQGKAPLYVLGLAAGVRF